MCWKYWVIVLYLMALQVEIRFFVTLGGKVDLFCLIWGINASFAKKMADSLELIFLLFLPLWDPGILRYNEAVYIIKRNSFGSNWLIKVSSVKQRLDNSSGNFKCFDHCWCLCVRNIWWHVLNHTKDNCRKKSKSNCSFSKMAIVLCTSCQLSIFFNIN